MTTKHCHKCRQVKPVEAFGKSKQTRDGLQGNCRACKRAYYKAGVEAYQARHLENYALKRDEIRARTSGYYRANQERMQATSRARYARLPSEVKAEAARKATERDREFPAQAAARVALRRARVRRAAPPWLTAEHRRQMQSFYQTAEGLGMLLGEWHHVDHIVPVRGKTVCGLHVPWNLQVLPAKENLKKLNSTWPDKP